MVNGGAPSTPVNRVVHPRAGSACTTPPNGWTFSSSVDGTTFNVCVSQEGNINQISFPGATGQIAWDGYCLFDADSSTRYTDYSPGSGVTFSGWGAATLTLTPPEIASMTRTTLDGKYQLTEFIKVNIQPRSVFVGMTIKNIDPANVTHHALVTRTVRPAIEGSPSSDEYNEYGVGMHVASSTQYGRTGRVSQSPGPGTNSLLFGPTQNNGFVFTSTTADFVANPCAGNNDLPGPVTGGDRVFVGAIGDPSTGGFKEFTLAPNASVNGGKFVYRMV
jgi:hypothetical protein